MGHSLVGGAGYVELNVSHKIYYMVMIGSWGVCSFFFFLLITLTSIMRQTRLGHLCLILFVILISMINILKTCVL